jgi:hypothetical protein
MRNEQEMLDLILNVAKADDRIRAVYMNGSRTNPNVKKDWIRIIVYRKSHPPPMKIIG